MPKRFAWLLAVYLGLSPAIVSAHAFGQRYDLPIPIQYFYWGAGAALVVSFLLISWFIDERRTTVEAVDISTWPVLRFVRRLHWLTWLIQLIVISLFALAIVAGFIGSDLVSANFAPTFFWIIVWIGLPILSLIFGNIWQTLSPWRTIFRWLTMRRQPPRRTYPITWGVWPAVFTYIIFTRLELISDIGYLPTMVAQTLILYSLLLFGGALIYGEAWLENVDFFAVLSRLIGRVSLIAYDEGRLILRLPGTGLLKESTDVPGLVAFICFLLAGVTFDGFKESLFANLLILHMLDYFPSFTPAIVHSLELLVIFSLYLSLYYLCRWVIQLTTKVRLAAPGHQFIVSFVPIGIAYTLAHYYSFLLIQGQAIIPLLSDPFGWGSNWFRTANYTINIGLIGVKTLWYFEVTFVVLGHIIGVYVAHLVALRIFKDRTLAMRSQYPVLVAMLILTTCSLWILSTQLGK